jgi:hypothetical protein
MELSTAAKRNWHHRAVERALIESGDHSPRTAHLIVEEAIREAPAFAWNDVAAAHWVRIAPATCDALGITDEEHVILEGFSADELTTILACGGQYGLVEADPEDYVDPDEDGSKAQMRYLEGGWPGADQYRAEEEADRMRAEWGI